MMDDDRKKFNFITGRMMKHYRNKCGITEDKMASMLDCSVGHIRSLERGNVSISAYEISVYAKECRMGAGMLLGLDEISVPLKTPVTETEKTCVVGICALLQHMLDKDYAAAHPDKEESES